MKYNVLNLVNGELGAIYCNGELEQIERINEYTKYKNICLSLFEWENVPENININFIEECLYNYGKAMFVYDDTLGYIIVPCVASNEYNFQNEPLYYRAIAQNYNKQFKKEDVIIIRNNPLELPSDNTILNYSYKISSASVIASINVDAQKTPILILCDDKDLLTLKNIYQQYAGNEPVIFGDKNLNMDSVRVLKTDAPYVADKILDYKHQLRNELLTSLGINNSNTDKKERLISSEVDSNNMEVLINKHVMLNERLKACKLINKKFGLNLNVKFTLEDYNILNELDAGDITNE